MQRIRTLPGICHGLASETLFAAIISLGTMLAVLLIAMESEKPAVLPACRNPLEISNSRGDVAVLCDPTTESLSQAYQSLGLDLCPLAPLVSLQHTHALPPRVLVGSDCSVDSMNSLSGETSVMLGLPIDVNRASAEDLQVVRGIGPALASRIVDRRQAKGFFRQHSDLEEIRGIGPVMSLRFSRWLLFSAERPPLESPEPGIEGSSKAPPKP